jgi:hypothetical protein
MPTFQLEGLGGLDHRLERSKQNDGPCAFFHGDLVAEKPAKVPGWVEHFLTSKDFQNSHFLALKIEDFPDASSFFRRQQKLVVVFKQQSWGDASTFRSIISGFPPRNGWGR